MSRKDTTKQSLDNLLRLCTVKLSVAGVQGHGSGFFVAPGLIITCAHVVEAAQSNNLSIKIYWNQQSYIGQISVFLAKPYPDLALIETDISNHPCVYLHEAIEIGEILYSYGYSDDYPDGDSATFVYEGPTNAPQPLQKLKQGQARPGMSGSPILNRRTGGVCGMLKRTRDETTDLGGRAIPTTIVFQKLESLKSLQHKFHRKNRAWLGALNSEQREILTGPQLTSQEKEVVVTAPQLPQKFIPRPQELETLKSAIIGGGAGNLVAITALEGMGGIGKSVLAMALCHSTSIQREFHDGVLWVTIGREPSNLTNQMQAVGQMLGDAPGYYISELAAVNRLRNLLARRAVLIVLDDVWDIKQVEPFLVQGKHYRVLITTRDSNIARSLGANEIKLGVLQPEQAIELLRDWTGRNDSAFAQIARRLGYLPLALKLAGARLYEADMTGQQWLATFTHISQIKLGRYPQNAHESIAMCIDLSIDRLNDEDRQLYYALGIFPEDIYVPQHVITKLWNQMKPGGGEGDLLDLIIYLARLALVEYNAINRTVKLHDILYDYARLKLQERIDVYASIHNDLLIAYNPTGRAWHTIQNDRDGYLYSYIAYHLNEASRKEELRALLLDLTWLKTKLEVTGNPNGLISDYELGMFPDEQTNRQSVLNLVRSALQLSVHILAEEKTQLWEQIYGRLMTQEAKDIHAMLQSGGKNIWLRPLSLCLIPPGGVLLWTLKRYHESSTAQGILSVAIDGGRDVAIVASNDRTLSVWDLNKGKWLYDINAHLYGVSSVAISQDGRVLISASYDHTLKLWELNSREMYTEIRMLKGHACSVMTVALSSDGRRAISGDQHGVLKLWDVETGQEIRTLIGHRGSIMALALMPGGQTAISGSYDRTLKLWNLESGQEIYTLIGHTDAVVAVAIHVDQNKKLILSGSADKTLRLWNGESGKEICTFQGHFDWVRAVTFNSNGTLAISGSYDNRLKLWDVETGQERRTLKGHRGHGGQIMAIALSTDDKMLVSGAFGALLQIWNLQSNQEQPEFLSSGRSIMSIAMSQNGKVALCGSSDGSIQIWDVEKQVLRAKYESQRIVRSVAMTADGKIAIVGSYDHVPKVWDVEHGQEIRLLKGHSNNICAVTISNDGTIAASGSWDNTIRVWNLKTGETIFTLTGHYDYIYSLALTPDNKVLISGSNDKTIRIWDMEKGKELHTLTGHNDYVTCLALASEGKILFSGARDGEVKIWNLETRREIPTAIKHQNVVWSLATSRDGRTLASVSEDCSVKIWNWEKAQVIASFYLDGPLYSCAFAPDNVIITGGAASGNLSFFKLEGYTIGSSEKQFAQEPFPSVVGAQKQE